MRIDTPVWEQVKRIQKQRGGSLGCIVTELLSEALAQRSHPPEAAPRLEWFSKPMDAKIALTDHEVVWDALDADAAPNSRF